MALFHRLAANAAKWRISAVAIGLAGAATAAGLSVWSPGTNGLAVVSVDETRMAVLSGLRDEINAHYGFSDKTPRINCGPCGRFAVLFRAQWNARFGEELKIAYILSPDRSFCGHVLLRFRNGTYFDGGNGVLTGTQLAAMFSDHPIEEMTEFDLERLDKLVGGLNQSHYPHCPNYSDDITAKLIDIHLAKLPAGKNTKAIQ